MSTSTPQTELTNALASLSTELSGSDSVSTSLSNASKDKTLKAAQASIATGQTRLSTAEGTLATAAAAWAAVNTPPTPTPPAPTSPQPNVPAGTFPGPMGLVFTGFDGVTVDTFDETIWTPNEGGTQNGVTTHASNVSVIQTTDNGVSIKALALMLDSDESGANISSLKYGLEVGHAMQMRLYIPGNGIAVNNWPAGWAGKPWSSEPEWPAEGEPDTVEGLGTATCGYQYAGNEENSLPVPGVWTNAFHDYLTYRTPTQVIHIWDGTPVKAFTTYDNGEPQPLCVTIGYKAGRGALVTGPASAVLVASVYAWAPEAS